MVPRAQKCLWDIVPTSPLPSGDLTNTAELLVGIRSFAPGADFPAHFHTQYDEVFIGLTGRLIVWLDRLARPLDAGDVLVCPRTQEHYVINDSSSIATIAVVKAPNLPDDYHPVEWRPDGPTS